MVATLELSRAELWFCAPDVPACSEARLFDVATNGQTWRVRARVVPSVARSAHDGWTLCNLFVQEENEDGLGAVLRHQQMLCWRDGQSPEQKRWLSLIRETLENKGWRDWQPPNEQRYVISLSIMGRGAIYRAKEPDGYQSGVGFHWNILEDGGAPARLSQSEFDNYCLCQFENENSPLRLAYQWFSWDELERTTHVLRGTEDTLAELFFLARCVLVLTFDTIDEGYPLLKSVWDVLEGNFYPFQVHSDILNRWSQTLRRVFDLPVLREDVPHYERQHFYKLEHELYPKFLMSQPSAHEKLEAMLQLRDWVQTHAPDEAAQLLNFPA